MSDDATSQFNLVGQCLIAMPAMGDARFARSVVLICSHNADGAMGFVINQKVVTPAFTDILEELKLGDAADQLRRSGRTVPVHRGGPVEKGRGFVLHSFDFGATSTARVGDTACLTATLDVLKKICSDNPPEQHLMLLGYSAWSAGQLEKEIAENAWLTVHSNPSLIFDTPTDSIYDVALSELGISEAALSAFAGHA